MSRNDTYLSLCLEQASLSSLHYRHGCIIVRGGKIIGKGYNDYRSGFNGGAQNTGKLGLHGPKQKNPQDNRPQSSGTRNRSAGPYVAFNSQDHAVGTGGSSVANMPLSMHSEMMAINSALSLSSAIACQGTARSTEWLQKPCFKLPSRSKRQSRLQHLKAYADAIFDHAEEQAAALERRGGSYVQQSRFEASRALQHAARAGGLLQCGGGGGGAAEGEEEERAETELPRQQQCPPPRSNQLPRVSESQRSESAAAASERRRRETPEAVLVRHVRCKPVSTSSQSSPETASFDTCTTTAT